MVVDRNFSKTAVMVLMEALAAVVLVVRQAAQEEPEHLVKEITVEQEPAEILVQVVAVLQPQA